MTNQTNRRSYACQECQKSFTQTSSLAAHKRTHSGEKPFSCDVCGREFANSGNMRTHMRIHTGERPFECVFCGRGFSQRGSLKAHLRIHNEEKPFTCEHCNRAFRVLGNLRKHLVVHSNEVPFGCDVCGRRFKLKSDLKRHYKTFHSLDLNAMDTDITSSNSQPVLVNSKSLVNNSYDALLKTNLVDTVTPIIINPIKIEEKGLSPVEGSMQNYNLTTINLDAISYVTGFSVLRFT